MNQFERTQLLYGTDYLNKLTNKHIAIFGIGGVGGSVLESLVRTGIDTISIFDFDDINITNLNRQIVSTYENIGELKVDAFEKRIKLINPNINLYKYPIFVGKETIDNINFSEFDFVVDAMDNVTAKLLVIEKALSLEIPIISSMGTGNKTDSSQLAIMDIYKTKNCPLAKVMRNELRKRKVKKLKVLSSTELPVKHEGNKYTVASSAFIPNIAGLKIGEYVINELLKDDK